jgi:hypothetical protein
MHVSPKLAPQANIPDDASWGQLNQVTSVDEEELRKKSRHQHQHSNSSSLTNSPTNVGGGDKAKTSLDSLSSVASAQAPLKESPHSDNASLDLMKCASGSSALLLPTHQRQDSWLGEKRSLEEDEREGPESKKKKRSSPLSIECSPNAKKMEAPSTLDSFYEKTIGLDGPPMPGPVPEKEPPAVGQIPSWEIHPQDSFGTGQVMSSFSFQDYPMLGASNSTEQIGNHQHAHHHHGHPHQAMIESRNQSFEGGHYHGSFSRSDSMMSYEGPPPQHQQHPYEQYRGPFPPHAPSWGSAGYYPQYPPPTMMRVPPPEFRAPPSMAKSGPQHAPHILSSMHKSSNFVWSKEEDMRLTEIMKKFKNPRDWEPIAKEHGCNRSAKECHERWIRYLKPGVRKGQWTDHEDAIVVEAVSNSSEQPFTRWSDLAQRLPGRVGKQIRDRWVNHLNPAINHLPFSREDDLLLWEGHKKLGKRWVEISTKYFNSTRSENHIKNRWYSASFKKFITNEFGADAMGKKKETPTSPKKKKEAVAEV